MYKCHLCSLETEQLNGLMSRHWKKHCNNSYTKDQYKIEVLAHNGRQLNSCEVCNELVLIPKGESESPRFHKKCYALTLTGANNPNYKGGKTKVKCPQCNKLFSRHRSQLNGKINFCSISCSMVWHAKPENRTDKQVLSDNINAQRLKRYRLTSKFKIAQAKALAKMQKDKKSNLEIKALKKIRKIYPSALDQVVKDFYTIDIYIPEIDTYVDIHGNYWHNKPKHQSSNSTKRNFFDKKNISYLELWGNEIHHHNDLVYWAKQKPKTYIICGPAGVGKTWLINKLKDYVYAIDSKDLEKCVNNIKISKKQTILEADENISALSRYLAEHNIRCSIVFINENKDIIKKRLSYRKEDWNSYDLKQIGRYVNLGNKFAHFVGTQNQAYLWILNHLDIAKQ